jgi:uncharacterized damage-inducible protein DinB
MSAVEEAIGWWERFRAGTIAELENIPEERWGERPGEGARDLLELARHVAEAGVGFTHELLRGDDASFARLFDPRVQAELRAGMPSPSSKAEAIELLRQTGADGARRLRAAADALAGQTMQSFGQAQSRLTALWFAISHEMYHRGQIAMRAREAGCVPVLTQQMRAARPR